MNDWRRSRSGQAHLRTQHTGGRRTHPLLTSPVASFGLDAYELYGHDATRTGFFCLLLIMFNPMFVITKFRAYGTSTKKPSMSACAVTSQFDAAANH